MCAAASAQYNTGGNDGRHEQREVWPPCGRAVDMRLEVAGSLEIGDPAGHDAYRERRGGDGDQRA